MADSLIVCVGIAVCAAILYGCDVATFAFLANPDPKRAGSVRLLSLLSSLAVAGFYAAGMAFLTIVIVSSYQEFGVLAGKRWDPNRAVIGAGVVGGLTAAMFARSLIKSVARRRNYPHTELTLPKHAGASQPWFVAMQYYALMLNRTYKVFITDTMLCGAKVVGLVASPPTPRKDQVSPEDWVSTLAASLYERLDVTSPDFMRMNFANFQIRWSDIDRVDFDTSPKWGMGNVPYSGRIFLRLKSGRSKELILLGQQDGLAIKEKLDKSKADSDLR